jgi:hypothetical protein
MQKENDFVWVLTQTAKDSDEIEKEPKTKWVKLDYATTLINSLADSVVALQNYYDKEVMEKMKRILETRRQLSQVPSKLFWCRFWRDCIGFEDSDVICNAGGSHCEEWKKRMESLGLDYIVKEVSQCR